MGPMRGVQEMIERVKQLSAKIPTQIGAAVRGEAEIEATEVKKRTPVWNSDRPVAKNAIPGALRASIHVNGPFYEGNKISATIVAGGVAGAYALRQHEDLDYFHKVGQARYISSVIEESRPHIVARVAARIDLSKLAG